MGFYKDDKHIYEPTDEGDGICSSEIYQEQQRCAQEKLDHNNAGEIGSKIPAKQVE